MPTEITPMRLLTDPPVWIQRRELDGTLRELGCENLRRARQDFEAYGVAKFAKWDRCRCGSVQHFTSREVRRLDA